MRSNGAIAEPGVARRREFSCFCVAKCEPLGEQKKTREVSAANGERPNFSCQFLGTFSKSVAFPTQIKNLSIEKAGFNDIFGARFRFRKSERC